MLHINNACIAFGTEVLFSGFSMKLERGETACIVGQSGCGKTSLLNAVMGFVPLKEGSIQVGEYRLSIVSADRLHGFLKNWHYLLNGSKRWWLSRSD